MKSFHLTLQGFNVKGEKEHFFRDLHRLEGPAILIAILLGYDENLGLAKKKMFRTSSKDFSNFKKLTKVVS